MIDVPHAPQVQLPTRQLWLAPNDAEYHMPDTDDVMVQRGWSVWNNPGYFDRISGLAQFPDAFILRTIEVNKHLEVLNRPEFDLLGTVVVANVANEEHADRCVVGTVIDGAFVEAALVPHGIWTKLSLGLAALNPAQRSVMGRVTKVISLGGHRVGVRVLVSLTSTLDLVIEPEAPQTADLMGSPKR